MIENIFNQKNFKKYIVVNNNDDNNEEITLDLKLKDYIKDNFGEKTYFKMKKEFNEFSPKEKEEWSKKLLKIIKESLKNEKIQF